MNPQNVLALLSVVLLAGCTSSYVAQALPADHPANPRAKIALYSPPPNPFKQAVAPPPKVSQARVEGSGKVIAVVPTSGQIVVDHEEIKGVMDAMTMGYKVKPPSLLQGLKAGDKVRFTIDTKEKVIVKIVKEK